MKENTLTCVHSLQLGVPSLQLAVPPLKIVIPLLASLPPCGHRFKSCGRSRLGSKLEIFDEYSAVAQWYVLRRKTRPSRRGWM